MPREHVHFVDQVHLVAGARGRVGHVVDQFPRVLDLGARGRVHLDQVDAAAFGNFQAARTGAAGRGADAAFAVETAGEDARDGGLAHTAGAGKQIGVVETITVQRMAQRLQYVLLTDQGVKCGRTPFSRQHLIGHIESASSLEAARTATPRHMPQQLPLLPSGPGGFHCLTLRGDRPGHPYSPREGLRIVAKSAGASKGRPVWYSNCVRIVGGAVAIRSSTTTGKSPVPSRDVLLSRP